MVNPNRRIGLRSTMSTAGVAACLLLGGCGEQATLSIDAGTGPDPVLPAPRNTLLPTINIAPARGWSDNTRPRAAAGLTVAAYARDLDHPRWLSVLPNGDVLVAESNAPAKSKGTPSLKNWVMQWVMRRAGAGGRSADRITLLRDNDGDGVAEVRSVILDRLKSPFGMVLVDERLFVATADAVLAFPYRGGETTIKAAPVKLLDLPGDPRNHHWTKNIVASPDGAKMYVTVGSNSNVAEHGMAIEEGRAAIWEVTLSTGAHRIFASGLRNPVGMAWMPANKSLWTVVNERDELGSDLVPDYLTAVHDGGFYGWPYSYFGQHVDVRVTPARPDRVASAIMPDYALGPHIAPLGLASSAGSTLAGPFVHGMFVAQHGSWNRSPASGYKVIFIPFQNAMPHGIPIDVLTGFINEDGEAQGRPAGIAIDKRGALLVADDVGNVVWRVTADR